MIARNPNLVYVFLDDMGFGEVSCLTEVVERLTALMTPYVCNGRSTPGAPQLNTGPRHWPQ